MMMLLWFTVVSAALLPPVRAESDLLLEVLGYNITFDADTLQQFTQCLSAPENILCSLNITGCGRPFILTVCSADFAAARAAQLNTTLNHISYYSCELVVGTGGIHEWADAINCQRLRDISGYNLSPEHCTPLSATSNLTNSTEYVTVVWKPSQQFSVRRRYNITSSKEIYGVCILTNEAFPASVTNSFHLIITVPLIGFVIVILIIIIIFLRCWKTKGKVWNIKHMGVRRSDSLNCSAILKSYASPQQERTLTPEQSHRGPVLMGRETDYTAEQSHRGPVLMGRETDYTAEQSHRGPVLMGRETYYTAEHSHRGPVLMGRETDYTAEQNHRGPVLIGRETDYTAVTAINMDTANIYSRLHEDVGRREATYDVLQPRQDTAGRRPR